MTCTMTREDDERSLRLKQLRQEKEDLKAIAGFMPNNQARYLAECFRTKGYECEHGQALASLRKVIEGMPCTYQQRELGDDAVILLHYFAGSSDWWIIEKDAGDPDDAPEDFQSQAWGFACLNGDYQSAETGYISIAELISYKMMQLDFHYRPQTLGQVKAAIEAR